MDPYQVLGISRNATLEEAKFAFRKEASKCHPDKAGDDPGFVDRFQAINLAFQKVSKLLRSPSENNPRQSDTTASDIDFSDIDDEIWNARLDYAISLMRSGLTREDIENNIQDLGYSSQLSSSLCARAFEIKNAYPLGSDGGDSNKEYSSNPGEKRIEDKYTRAYLEGGSSFSGSRKELERVNYYQDTFRELYIKENEGFWLPLNSDRYLFKLLFRSLLFFTLIVAVVFYTPGLAHYIPIGDLELFQLPNVILAFMLVWAVRRKLWVLSLIGLAFFAATQIYFYYTIPIAIEKDVLVFIFASLPVFIPFILLTLYSDYFFYQKARATIVSVSLAYPEEGDRLLFIKNRGGTSKPAGMAGIAILTLYFVMIYPMYEPQLEETSWLSYLDEPQKASPELTRKKQQVSFSQHKFEVAEEYYSRQPAAYQLAARAYEESARAGSLLSAYKLGFMYLIGQGVTQDDGRAFFYFNKAADASPSSQPHNLNLTTRWLAESYNSLGIMYLGGYGTPRNLNKARQMLKLAVKFGSSKLDYPAIRSAYHRNENLRYLVISPNF